MSDITDLMVRELNGFRLEIALFPDDESIWRTLPGVTNSAANLALHVAGNLQHYAGAVLGGSGYVRHRDVEFGRKSGTKAEVIAEINAAIRAVEQVTPGLAAERLRAIYPETVIAGKEIRTELFLLHLCTHAAYHLAQAGYLRRIMFGDNRASGAMSLAALVG
jgi:hypothetical protein